MDAFRELGLSETTIRALEKKGYTEPTEIQAKTIPLLLKGDKDIVGQSQTGTGKTASFALPIIERLKGSKGVKALILTPTRELAVQVTKEFELLKGNKHLKTLTVYGGTSISNQINALQRGIDIVVGTPGRVIDLIERKKLVITDIEYCVLDEADEMLNMGFIDDIKLILKKTPKDKKMLLFSATIPPQIKKIAEKFMNEYITIRTKQQDLVTDLVEQIYYSINSGDRFEGLRRIMDITPDFHGLIFCNTKLEVDRVCSRLQNAGYQAGALHGDITQAERERILGKFKKRKIVALVATDVAARGIDVKDMTHVINYSLPQTPEVYVHRIGRTGRAGKTGVAITFVIPSERHKLKHVERFANCRLVRRELPSVKDVVKVKQIYFEERIDKLLKKSTGKYDELSASLLEKGSAREVVGALLDHIYGKEEKEYQELNEVPEKVKPRSRDRRDSKKFGRRGSGREDKRRRGRHGDNARENRRGRREDGGHDDSDRSGREKKRGKKGKEFFKGKKARR